MNRFERMLAFLLLGLVSLGALTLPARAQRFEARLFGQEDGLDNLVVTGLAQDPQGFLWIATQNGLFRYDGARFQVYGKPEGMTETSIFSLLVDRQGTLWVGTHSGLFWCDGQLFHELKSAGASLRVGTNSMMAVTSKDEVVVATSKGIFSVLRGRQNGPSIAPYPVRHPSFPRIDDMNGIGVDGRDALWVGCGEAICGFREPASQRLGPEQGVPPDFYMGFFSARDGRMYARGRKHIVTWKPDAKTVTDLTALFPPGAMSTIHRRFIEDSFGHVLTPTAAGFAAWDGTGWTETASTGKGEIDGASDLLSDREGALWIGTQGSGLLQALGYGLWKNYGTAEGLPDPHVFAFAAGRPGTIWVGHDRGVSLLRQGAVSQRDQPLAHEEDATQIQAMAPSPDGGIWVGALLGHIYHVNAAGRVDIHAALDTYVRQLSVDPGGRLWAATSTGLYTLDCKPEKPCTPQPVDGLTKAVIRDLVIDPQGAIWASDENGIYRIEAAKSGPSPRSHSVIPIAIDDSSLRDFNLIAPAPDGTLWFTCGTPGVFRISITPGSRESGPHLTGKVVETHTARDLVSSNIVSLDLDRAGRLWIGTDHGLNVLENGKLSQITGDDGLIWNDIDSRAFLADADGSIWIGTSHGISHLLRPSAVLTRQPFAARIEAGQYGEKILGDGAKLAWTGGPMTIRFSGLTFRDNRTLLFHYSLLGFDATPIATKSVFVRFQKLPPGSYTLHVVAEDPVHGVFSAPAEFAFTLTPPWWRTHVFYAFLLFLALCIFALIWRWSQSALLAQRNKLQRLVAERTYELEQMAVRDSLTGLLNRNAILTALTNEIQNAHKYKAPLCIALIDLDHFKSINDTYGHLAGDEVLRRSAERLQGAIRSTDAIGRYGGEEFLIIFRNVQQQFGLERCEVVRGALCAEPIVYGEHLLNVTCSIGYAWSGTTNDPLNGLIAKADQAMYRAKENGRNRTEFAAAD